MRTIMAVMMAAALMAAPAGAQQHAHGQAADSSGTMGMMQAGMMQGHCAMTPGGMMGMMRGMMQGGMMEGRPGMMQGGMMQSGMMEMAGGPGMILGLEESLNLSDSQVEALKEMKESMGAEVQQHMMQGMQARQAAVETLQAESPDLDAYEEKLREAVNHMVLAHTAMARGDAEARQQLTADQLEKLAFSKNMMMEMCRGGMSGGMMKGGTMSGGHPNTPGQGG